MTNKEKAVELLHQLDNAQCELDNALEWGFPRNEIRRREKKLNDIKNELIALIPD